MELLTPEIVLILPWLIFPGALWTVALEGINEEMGFDDVIGRSVIYLACLVTLRAILGGQLGQATEFLESMQGVEVVLYVFVYPALVGVAHRFIGRRWVFPTMGFLDPKATEKSE